MAIKLRFIFLAFLGTWIRPEDQCKAGDETNAALLKGWRRNQCKAGDEGTVRTLAEELIDMCPTTRLTGGKLGAFLLGVVSSIRRNVEKLTAVSGKELFTPGWADDFSIAAYEGIVQANMRMYKARDKSYVNIPTEMATNETIKRGSNYAAYHDPDGTPNYFWDRYIPGFMKSVLIPLLTCFFESLRQLPFEDTLDDPSYNTWDILKNGEYNNKKDWILSFYNNVQTMSGDPSWPPRRMDFTTLFRNGDLWDDGLESAFAFNAIGIHRVEMAEKIPDALHDIGEALPYVLKLNDFASFAVRPGFGKLGVDMYFTATGLPAVLQTTDGNWVKRGQKDWQYWKFVWRSSLITIITLVDHLHLTHIKAANTLARAVRVALPANHAMRRFLSIFTFGTFFSNLLAQLALVGRGSWLDRAAPFQDFGSVSEVVPRILPDIALAPGMKALTDDDEFDKLPTILQEAPFYADGRLVFRALHQLVRRFTEASGQCQALKSDKHVLRMIKLLKSQAYEAQYTSNLTEEVAKSTSEELCVLLPKRLAVYMFTVTAYHSHVGFLGDYYNDPDLCGASWKVGERSSRPRQAIIMSIITATTAIKQPMLTEDFTHLFKDGLDAGLSERLVAVWRDFIEDMAKVKKEIDRRNTQRKIPNINMDPAMLECSVSN